MATQDTELLTQAVDGDELALQRLLIPLQSRLMRRIEKRLPERFRPMVSPEDVLQETYVEVFVSIGNFVPQEPDSFERWLFRIVDNHTADVHRRYGALKRGGGRRRVETEPHRSSVVSLLEMINVDSQTPSRTPAFDEAVAAMQIALASLKADYREALRLRYLDGLSVDEVSRRMQRSPWSIQKLCHRGLDRLRESMGRMSQFLSIK